MANLTTPITSDILVLRALWKLTNNEGRRSFQIFEIRAALGYLIEEEHLPDPYGTDDAHTRRGFIRDDLGTLQIERFVEPVRHGWRITSAGVRRAIESTPQA